MEGKERHADDVRKDVELASIEADKILADQVDLDIKIRVGTSRNATHSETSPLWQVPFPPHVLPACRRMRLFYTAHSIHRKAHLPRTGAI